MKKDKEDELEILAERIREELGEEFPKFIRDKEELDDEGKLRHYNFLKDISTRPQSVMSTKAMIKIEEILMPNEEHSDMLFVLQGKFTGDNSEEMPGALLKLVKFVRYDKLSPDLQEKIIKELNLPIKPHTEKESK